MKTNSFYLKYLLIGLPVWGLLNEKTIAQGNKSKLHIETGSSISVFTGGNTNSSFIIKDGSLWSCGDNVFGQSGTGNNTDAASFFRQVGIEKNWAMVATGSFHTIALQQDGSLWSWGDNQYGQLGNASVLSKNAPVRISQSVQWTMIAAADYQSFAIRKDGTLWAWGVNNYGQLGIENDTGFISTPQQVGSGHDWKAVSAGSFHTLALKNDGTLWAWGYGADGQLGLGNSNTYKQPVQVGNADDWEMISAAGFHSFALRKDGTLWSWGDNEYGVLGNGNTVKQLEPVQVGNGNNWEMVATGFHHTAAIRADGTLWTWGNNFSGELGLGYEGAGPSYPLQAGNDNNWKYVSTGYAHTLAVKADHTSWAWGQNDYGQLGTGDLSGKSYPVINGNGKECAEDLPPAR